LSGAGLPLPSLETAARALEELDAPPDDTKAAVATTIAVNTIHVVGP
jgi:hypothetical protein